MVAGGLYQRLGLEPVSTSFRRVRSSAGVRARLERWERTRGGAALEALRLERLPLETARELAGVYVSLRERFPTVAAGRIDFASRRLGDVLGEVTLPGPETAATIELSVCLGHPRCVDKVRRYWEDEARRASARAAPPRVAPSLLSEPALVLVHEFGHLVDHHLESLGRSAAEHVYGALSRVALPERVRRRPRPHQWTGHLLNYPVDDPGALRGRAAGGPARAAIIKRTLAPELGVRFGRYATKCREELFAEAFAAMYGSPDRELRASLVRVRRALEDVGVARRRRC